MNPQKPKKNDFSMVGKREALFLFGEKKATYISSIGYGRRWAVHIDDGF